jgi:glycosyltransferase involved in cell wall biosynthesis
MKRIAFIGIRGIPLVYSGFETCAEQITPRLVQKGWDVTVYCRRHSYQSSRRSYKGVSLVILPSLNVKGLDTFTHSLFATLHVIFFRRTDIVYYFGVGSALFSILPRLFGIRTIVNVDGLDWKREKWGFIGRSYLRLSERLALQCATYTLTDSHFVHDYYAKHYLREIGMIPYGYTYYRPDKNRLKPFHLQPSRYIVWTGRLVPDNHLDELIQAFQSVPQDICLIVVGNGTESKIPSDPRIRYVGFVDRLDYAALVAYSLLYVETKRSGGTHPSLLDAMGYKALIVSNDYPSNKEVLGSTALYYAAGDSKDLANTLIRVLTSPYSFRRFQASAYSRARTLYSWDAVLQSYLTLFQTLFNGRNDKAA